MTARERTYGEAAAWCENCNCKNPPCEEAERCAKMLEQVGEEMAKQLGKNDHP